MNTPNVKGKKKRIYLRGSDGHSARVVYEELLIITKICETVENHENIHSMQILIGE